MRQRIRDRWRRSPVLLSTLVLILAGVIGAALGRSAEATAPDPGQAIGQGVDVGPAVEQPVLVNGDFELPGMADGFAAAGSPDGWSGGFGVFNPNGGTYSALGNGRATIGSMAGPTVLQLFERPGRSVVQTTGTVIRPGVRYTLTVAVGERDNADRFGGAVLNLLVGTQVVADRTVTVAPVQGSFGDVDVSWTADAAHAGRALAVGLGQAPGGGPGTYVDLDNVRLTASGRARPATDVVVVSPVEHQVVQRGADATATVTVRVSAPAGTVLRARVVPRAGAAGRVSPWQRLSARAGGQEFAGSLGGVSAGWYDLQVRSRLPRSRVERTRTVERVGVGEVFIAAGQSNSANHGERPLTARSDQVSAPTLGFTAWQGGTDPQPNATGTGGSPWPQFGDQLNARTAVPIGVVAVGYGGTGLAQWQPGGVLYPRLISAFDALGRDGFRAVLWHQGESDAHRCTPQEEYGRELAGLIERSRRDASFAVPWVVATASAVPGGSPACAGAIRRAQQDVVASVPGVSAGPDTDGYCAAGLCWDKVHFSASGLIRHADSWVESVLAAGILPAQPSPAP